MVVSSFKEPNSADYWDVREFEKDNSGAAKTKECSFSIESSIFPACNTSSRIYVLLSGDKYSERPNKNQRDQIQRRIEVCESVTRRCLTRGQN